MKHCSFKKLGNLYAIIHYQKKKSLNFEHFKNKIIMDSFGVHWHKKSFKITNLNWYYKFKDHDWSNFDLQMWWWQFMQKTILNKIHSNQFLHQVVRQCVWIHIESTFDEHSMHKDLLAHHKVNVLLDSLMICCGSICENI